MICFLETTSLDPAFFGVAADQARVHQIFNALVQYKPGSSTLEGDLAERWEISEDGKTYRFFLRKGVQWHKGYGELTAADVKWSLERILDPEVKSRYRGELVGSIEKIEVVDNYTLDITFVHPGEINLHKVAAFRQGYIVCRKALEEMGAEAYGQNPVGTGPYMVKEWVPGQYFILEYFPDYFEGPAFIGEIEFREIPEYSVAVLALEKGEIDVLIGLEDPDLYRRLKDNPVFQTFAPLTTGLRSLGFDLRVKPYDDLRVRQAIAHLIDNELIVETICGGLGVAAVSHLSPAFSHATTEGLPSYPYDPVKAKQLFEEAGVTELPPITMPATHPVIIEIALHVQDELRKIGVDVEVKTLEGAARTAAMLEGKLASTLHGFAARADEDILLTAGFHSSSSPPGVNMTWYGGCDDLIEQARWEVDPAKRTEIYRQVQIKLMEDLPSIPIYHHTYVEAISEKVINWQQRFFNDWRLHLVNLKEEG